MTIAACRTLRSPFEGSAENDLFSVNGKHVLVTGGSSGLGRHFAMMLAGRGAKVTLAARRAEALSLSVADIKAAGGDAFAW